MSRAALLSLISVLVPFGATTVSANQVVLGYEHVEGAQENVLQIDNQSNCTVNAVTVSYSVFGGEPERLRFKSSSGQQLGDPVGPSEVGRISIQGYPEFTSQDPFSHVEFTSAKLRDLSRISSGILGSWEFSQNSATLNVEGCFS